AMYTHFWRAAPHPALTVFDAPDAGTTCTRRNRSNTPLQALTLLNDAGFAEFAYGLAARVLADRPTGNDELVRDAFRLCLGRAPTGPELARLAVSRAKQGAPPATDAGGAAALLRGGGPAGKLLAAVPGVSEARKAATLLLARVLLNLDETITRE